MTTQLTELLRRLETRTGQLLEQRTTLRQQVVQLQEQLQAQQEEKVQLLARQKELSEQLSHLKMAKYIDMADNDVKDLRGRVRQMVRDIDKCIAMLKADETV